MSNAKRALITGITGQDGSYLAELLIGKGYYVWGMVRRSSSFNTGRIDHLYQDIHEDDVKLRLLYGDLNDGSSVRKILTEVQPDEVYNLGGQSHVKTSFDIPEYTGDTAGLGALRLLEAIREIGIDTRYYQASSSEMFGGSVKGTIGIGWSHQPQSEDTEFNPRSPYAAAKAYAYYMTRLYRDAYGLFACNGILFNHESCRRGETFVTRKITRAAARIKLGLQDCIYLGNVEAERDWGYAGDYVEAMWLMLQADKPDDFVIATGVSASVRMFCNRAFAAVGMDITWTGTGSDERGMDEDGEAIIRIDPRYYRPAEVDYLCGNACKAKRLLGWQPRVGLDELVRMMVDHDLSLVRREQSVPV